MKNNQKIAIIGGDERFLRLAAMLAADGYETCIFGTRNAEIRDRVTKCGSLECAVENSSLIILPIPYSRDGIYLNAPYSADKIRIDDIASLICPKQKLYGGLLAENIFECDTYDYYTDEAYQVANAIPTAEGAIMLAIGAMKGTLCSCNAYVLGYGRIGKILSYRLRAMGANVTVFARSDRDFAFCESFGLSHRNIGECGAYLQDADVIFNTVPIELFTENQLECLKKDAVFFELASVPCCKSERIIPAQSLPSKCAVATATDILYKTIKKRLSTEVSI